MTLDLTEFDVRPFEEGSRSRLEDLATALNEAVDAKGQYTPSHGLAVSRLAFAIGAHMGVEGDGLERLRLAGLLHDVGKLHVPDVILLKPGPLSPTEYDVVKRHPLDGHQMLLQLGLPDEARWVLHHHERVDGDGYPTRLRGDGIPCGSRILAVADAYHVIVTCRTYKTARRPAEAIHELRRCADHQFDRECVEALATVLMRSLMLQRPYHRRGV